MSKICIKGPNCILIIECVLIIIVNPGPEMKTKMCLSAVKRILNAEKTAVFAGVNSKRNKIIVTLASTYNNDVRNGMWYAFFSFLL